MCHYIKIPTIWVTLFSTAYDVNEGIIVQDIEVTIKFSFDNVTASSLNHSAVRRRNGASRALI